VKRLAETIKKDSGETKRQNGEDGIAAHWLQFNSHNSTGLQMQSYKCALHSTIENRFRLRAIAVCGDRALEAAPWIQLKGHSLLFCRAGDVASPPPPRPGLPQASAFSSALYGERVQAFACSVRFSSKPDCGPHGLENRIFNQRIRKS
jgi:hypothetical protein